MLRERFGRTQRKPRKGGKVVENPITGLFQKIIKVNVPVSRSRLPKHCEKKEEAVKGWESGKDQKCRVFTNAAKPPQGK